MSENADGTSGTGVGLGDGRRKVLPGRGMFYAGRRVDQNKLTSQAPGFHIIDHVIWHTSLDTPELVTAEGLECATRASLRVID